MNKVINIEEAMKYIKDGMTIMVGGFMGVGTPEALIDEMVKRSRSPSDHRYGSG